MAAYINIATNANKKFSSASSNDVQIYSTNSESKMFIGPANSTNFITIGSNGTTLNNVTITGDQTCNKTYLSDLYVTGGIYNSAGQAFASAMIQGNVMGVPKMTAYGGLIKVTNDPIIRGGTVVDASTTGVRNLEVYQGVIRVTNNTSVDSTISSTLGLPELTIYGGSLSVSNNANKVDGAYVPKYVGGVTSNMSFSNLYISSNVGVGVINPVYPLEVNGTIKATTVTQTSDVRTKENVKPLYCNKEILNKLRPVLYNYIDDKDKQQQAGLIAQEVEQVLPGLISTSTGWVPMSDAKVLGDGDQIKLKDGEYCKYTSNIDIDMISHYQVSDFKTINYSALSVYLLAAFQSEK